VGVGVAAQQGWVGVVQQEVHRRIKQGVALPADTAASATRGGGGGGRRCNQSVDHLCIVNDSNLTVGPSSLRPRAPNGWGTRSCVFFC
jgi:hypothetical protein